MKNNKYSTNTNCIRMFFLITVISIFTVIPPPQLLATNTDIIPIEDAPRMALIFNILRAEQLERHIPDDVLFAADEVFRK